MLFQQAIHLVKQVIEIHCTVLETTLIIGVVNIGYGRAVGTHILLLDIIIITVFIRFYQRIFCRRDTIIDDVGFIMFVVEVQLVDHGFDHALGVIGIIDRKTIGIAQ